MQQADKIVLIIAILMIATQGTNKKYVKNKVSMQNYSSKRTSKTIQKLYYHKTVTRQHTRNVDLFYSISDYKSINRTNKTWSNTGTFYKNFITGNE